MRDRLGLAHPSALPLERARRRLAPVRGVVFALAGFVLLVTGAGGSGASAAGAALPPAAAHLGGGASCPPGSTWCVVIGSGGGDGGSGGHQGGGSGTSVCTDHGVTVPCYVPGLGYFDDATGCYVQLFNPAPDDPIWAGHDPAKGVWWWATCHDGPPHAVWIPTTSAGPTPYALALQALARIRLDGPDIGLAPAPGGPGGLVGLPVWMWTTVTSHTWGPIGASASSGGITVRITATAVKIDWTMGDGTTVACTGPGMPYAAVDRDRPSPDCGHVYLQPSHDQPGGVYRVTATTTWRVAWRGGGASGVIVTTRAARTAVRINEQQVVVE